MLAHFEKKIGERLLIGRHEWCGIPSLSIPLIKAKVDTGAKTSALHAIDIKKIDKDNVPHAIFTVHPIQENTNINILCCAPIVDERNIMSSNGHVEERLIIEATLLLGGESWSIEVSLSNRDPLRYRFLLGREALKSHVLIDPGHGCYQNKISKKMALTQYEK